MFVDDGSADGTVRAVEELLAGAPGTPGRGSSAVPTVARVQRSPPAWRN